MELDVPLGNSVLVNCLCMSSTFLDMYYLKLVRFFFFFLGGAACMHLARTYIAAKKLQKNS